MRFKATVHNSQTLIDVLSSISSISKFAIFQFNSNGIIISCDTSGGHNMENCFIELRKDVIFDQYKIESKGVNNMIPFIAYIPHFIQALQSVGKASDIIMKLIKRYDRAFICCEASDKTTNTYSQQQRDAMTDAMSSNAIAHQVSQFIPIQVITTADYADKATEPELSAPVVKLMMPKLSKLHSIINNMRAIGHSHVEFMLSSDGNLTVIAVPDLDSNTDTTTYTEVKTYFKDLNLSTAQTLNPGGVPSVVKGKVKIQRLQNILHCKNLNATNVIGCIVEEGAFVLYLRLAPNAGTLTYYVPLVIMDDE